MARIKLTEKQKRFADYYIETANATEAALRANYSKNTAKEIGCENLTKPHIRAYIDKKISKKDNKRIASQNEVLSFLTAAMRGELTEEIVFNGEVGIVKDIKGTDIKDRLVAAKELGKRYLMDKQIDWNERKVVIAEKQVQEMDDDIIYETELNNEEHEEN